MSWRESDRLLQAKLREDSSALARFALAVLNSRSAMYCAEVQSAAAKLAREIGAHG